MAVPAIYSGPTPAKVSASRVHLKPTSHSGPIQQRNTQDNESALASLFGSALIRCGWRVLNGLSGQVGAQMRPPAAVSENTYREVKPDRGFASVGSYRRCKMTRLHTLAADGILRGG